MKVMVTIFLISALFAISRAGNLKFVSAVYRHGDRSPNYKYPTDPHPITTWEYGLGQLTNVGKNQAHELGKYMREHYQDFLPSKYYENDIYILSSDMSRTLMTAYCVLAGLYEPQGTDVWLESIHWQPIPVHSLSRNVDNLMIKRVPCPKYQRLLNDNVFVPNSETIDKFKEIIQELSTYTGHSMPNETMDMLQVGASVYDVLSVEERYGFELPEWTKKFYPEPLRNITKFRSLVRSYDVPLRRIRCGPLLKEIIQHMEEVRQGKLKLKMWQYSAHDQTVYDLLQCMRVHDGELVPYASTVFIELYETENDFEVGIRYRKNREVKELEVPGCKLRCPLDSFKELMKDVTPDNWEEECKL